MGALGCLRELVAHGANINAVDIEGYSALHQADGCSASDMIRSDWC